MDVINIANAIEKKITDLEVGRQELNKRAKAWANALAEYRHVIATTIIKLKNGVAFNLDGEIIQSPVNSIIESIARGICWKEKLAETEAEALYRVALKGMDALMAELNGLQSIYRHLSEK